MRADLDFSDGLTFVLASVFHGFSVANASLKVREELQTFQLERFVSGIDGAF